MENVQSGASRFPPSNRIIRDTRDYLTLSQAAQQLGMTAHGVHAARRRGAIKCFYMRGGKSPTGWTTYLRKQDIAKILGRKKVKTPVTLNEAAEMLGISRSGLYHYIRSGKLKPRKILFGGDSHGTQLWLERGEVESLTREVKHRRSKEPNAYLRRFIRTKKTRAGAIIELLRERPLNVSDSDIARAFRISRQRVHQLRKRLFAK